MSLLKNEKTEAGRVELQFTLGAEEFSAAVNSTYKKEAKNFNVPGFRKGKAPRHLIEKMYGEEIFYTDAVNELFPKAYEEAVKEAGIEPVDRPDAEIVSADLTDGVVLKALVYVKPEVKIGEYKGLNAVKYVNAVEDAEIDAEIGRIADRNSRLVTREGAAENGDVTNIDFEGFLDGTAFEGGKGEDFDLTLGSGQFIPGFEEQIVGHKAGDEFDVNVTFPEEYQAKELAGKEAVFKCKLNEVKYKELPALDDEFAKDVSEYDTLQEFKDSIRKGMQENNDKRAEMDMENALVEQVIASLEAEIPACMIESRIDEMVNDFSYRLQQQGLKLEMYLQYSNNTMEKFRDGFREQAEKQVKIRLALEKIAELEKIEASEEDVDKEVQRIAEAYKMEADKVRDMLPMDEVKKDLAVNKAIDFVREAAVVEEKPASEKPADAE